MNRFTFAPYSWESVVDAVAMYQKDQATITDPGVSALKDKADITPSASSGRTIHRYALIATRGDDKSQREALDDYFHEVISKASTKAAVVSRLAREALANWQLHRSTQTGRFWTGFSYMDGDYLIRVDNPHVSHPHFKDSVLVQITKNSRNQLLLVADPCQRGILSEDWGRVSIV